MDDRRPRRADASLHASATPHPATFHHASEALVPLRRCAACLAVASAVWALSGCSVFVMAGKMFFGDPKQTAAFRGTTDVDLTDGGDSVLIVATTPQSLRNEMPGVDLEVVARVSRTLRAKGVKVYPSKKVLTWLDDRGGQWADPAEIAAAFGDADYVVEVAVERFAHREENSPDLFRGRASGNVRAYEVVEIDGGKTASPVFSREFSCTYPSQAPKQAHQISERTFQEEFLGRVCHEISLLFYDHRASETVY